jgi:hypothetical protein
LKMSQEYRSQRKRQGKNRMTELDQPTVCLDLFQPHRSKKIPILSDTAWVRGGSVRTWQHVNNNRTTEDIFINNNIFMLI